MLKKMPNDTSTNIRWFRDIRLDDVALVGGKNASLGELYSVLSEQGVRVPNGFALTADAYRSALTEGGAWDRLHPLLNSIDKTRIDVLARCAAEARAIVFDATGTDRLRQEIAESYQQLEKDPHWPQRRTRLWRRDRPFGSCAPQMCLVVDRQRSPERGTLGLLRAA